MLRYLGCECQEESRTPLAPHICIQHTIVQIMICDNILKQQ